MKTYTTLRNAYSSITGRTASADLTLADQWLMDGIRKMLKAVPRLRETTKDLSTTASKQYVDLPSDCEQVKSGVKVTISGRIYTPTLITSREQFNRLAESTTYTSDYPDFYFVDGKKLRFIPTPANSTSNAVNVPYKKRIKDLGIADYTTGNIQAVTNGTTTVTGTGTSWTSSMAGRYLRITESDTANKGDGLWYEIASVESTTSLTLASAYQGTTIAAGTAAYTIGQMPPLPEDYHDSPLDWALYRYYKSKNDNARANDHFNAFEQAQKSLAADFGSATDSPVIDNGGSGVRSNPNNFISTTTVE